MLTPPAMLYGKTEQNFKYLADSQTSQDSELVYSISEVREGGLDPQLVSIGVVPVISICCADLHQLTICFKVFYTA